MSKARVARVGVLVCVLLLCAAAPSEAAGGWHGGWHGGGHSHGGYYGGPRVVVGVGPAYWWGPGVGYGPGWYGPAPYYAYTPPPVIVDQPLAYVERPAAPPGYWYYCESARAYYPNVSTCPERWVKVAPRPE